MEELKANKLDQKTLKHSFHLWFWGALTCFSQQHMQTFGYLSSMLPIIKKLYPKHEDQVKAIQAYTAFFNTNPMLGTVIVGVTASMEEARASKNEIDGETINDMRAGLMGPIAGIGDSLVDGTLIPILLGISLGMSTGGSPIGAIFYIIVWTLISYFGQRFLYFRGYHFGDKAVSFLVGKEGAAVRVAIGVIGSMVVGGVLASWVNVTTSFKLIGADGKVFLKLQDKIDSIYPGLLTILVTLFCWWLMSKKHVSAIWTMLILVVISLVGVLVRCFQSRINLLNNHQIGL